MLGANTRGLDKGFRKGTTLTKRFANATRLNGQTLKNVGGFFAGATVKAVKYGAALGAVAAGAAVVLIKKQFSLIDATAKLSDRLGIATEQLTGFQYAAGITGTDTEKLNKGFEFMSKALGEATRGVGEAKDALEMMGLTVDDLIDLTPDEAFKTLADSVKGLGTQYEKTYVASKLFGRGGLGMVNMLDLGRAGIEKLQQRAESLGITFNRLDASRIEAANDAILSTKEAVRGLAIQAAIDLAPFVKLFADDLTNAIINTNEPLKNMKDGTTAAADEFGILGSFIIDTVDNLHMLNLAWMEMSLAFHKGLRFITAGVELPGGKSPVQFIHDDIEMLEREVERLQLLDPGENLVDRLRDIREEMAKARNAAENIGTDGAFSMEDIEDPMEKRRKELEAWANQMRESLKTPFDKAVESVVMLREAIAENLITSLEGMQFFDYILDQLDDVDERLREFAAARRGLDFGGTGQGTQEAASRRFEIGRNENYDRQALKQRDEMVDYLRRLYEGQEDAPVLARAPF